MTPISFKNFFSIIDLFIDFITHIVSEYECGEVNPSIEIVTQLANTLDVSVDFLIGEGANALYDKEMVKRLDDTESLPKEEKKLIFVYIDLVIRDYKTKSAFGL